MRTLTRKILQGTVRTQPPSNSSTSTIPCNSVWGGVQPSSPRGHLGGRDEVDDRVASALDAVPGHPTTVDKSRGCPRGAWQRAAGVHRVEARARGGGRGE
eukprot:6520499-Pyramimonas_sp.AAC.4